MIYTSYYGNIRNFPPNSYTIAISRTVPPGVHVDKRLTSLAPSTNLLEDYKNHIVDDKGYTIIYLNNLIITLNKDGLRDKLIGFLRAKERDYPGGVFLLCYERPDQFCHRHLLANNLSIGITEYPIYKGSEINGQIGLVQ